MDLLFLIARILFVGVFLSSALGHFMATAAMTGYAESKGVRPGKPFVLGGGVLLGLGGLMVLLGIWADLGALLLVAFMLPTAFFMHGFWGETEPQARQMEQIQFFKDLGLAGGALVVFILTAYAGSDLGLQFTGPVFSLD